MFSKVHSLGPCSHHDTDTERNFIDLVGEPLGFSLGSQIKLNEIMTRLVIVLLWDLVTKVPQVIMPHFEPNLFAQTIEKYKVSVSCRRLSRRSGTNRFVSDRERASCPQFLWSCHSTLHLKNSI
jgi:hypothetical protein